MKDNSIKATGVNKTVSDYFKEAASKDNYNKIVIIGNKINKEDCPKIDLSKVNEFELTFPNGFYEQNICNEEPITLDDIKEFIEYIHDTKNESNYYSLNPNIVKLLEDKEIQKVLKEEYGIEVMISIK